MVHFTAAVYTGDVHRLSEGGGGFHDVSDGVLAVGAGVEVVEVAPLLAGGQSQGEARRQVAGPVQGRTVSRSQQQLEQFAVVEAGCAVAGRQVGMAGGAETVAVGIGLLAEHKACGAGGLGGAGS